MPKKRVSSRNHLKKTPRGRAVNRFLRYKNRLGRKQFRRFGVMSALSYKPLEYYIGVKKAGLLYFTRKEVQEIFIKKIVKELQTWMTESAPKTYKELLDAINDQIRFLENPQFIEQIEYKPLVVPFTRERVSLYEKMLDRAKTLMPINRELIEKLLEK